MKGAKEFQESEADIQITALNNKNAVLDSKDLTQTPVALNTDNSALNSKEPVTDANDLTQSPFAVLGKWGATPKPPPVTWAVHHLLQANAANYIAGEPGVGKSWVMCDLAVSVATGTPFLGRQTSQGPVLIINWDDVESLPRQYAERTARARGYDFNDLPIYYWEPRPDEAKPLDGMLDINVFQELAFQVEHLKPKMLIIDSFSSGFPGLNGNDGKDVVRAYEVLRQLRISSPGLCVVVIDHTPKEVVLQSKRRGVSGSQQKNAQVRAGHIISAIEPSEVGGEDVLRWDFHKMNAAPTQKPFAISREQTADKARLTVRDLPEHERAPKATQALEAALTLIRTAGEDGILRTELIEKVATLANVGRRTIETVINSEVRPHPQVVEKSLSGPGNPKMYKWRSSEDDGGSGNETETTGLTQGDNLTQSPIALNQDCEGRENTISRNNATAHVETALREKTGRFWPTKQEHPYTKEVPKLAYLDDALRLLISRGLQFNEPILARAEALKDYLEACSNKQCAELVLKPHTAAPDELRIEALAHYGAAQELTAAGSTDLFVWTEAATELIERRRRAN